MFAHNEVDFCQDIRAVAHHGNGAGPPITTLADLHVGCSEVFGKNDIRAVADLKGRTVGIAAAFEDELPVKIMGDLVALDPARDIHWVTSLSRDPMELVAEGKIDPFVAILPALQEVRARNIGHVIVSSLADPPWSQYYCCFFTARTDFARAYPVATRRVLRAILKAADLCASAPERIAQLLVDYALQALKGDIRYNDR